MSNLIERLDFLHPPLAEVSIGVQFAPVEGYSSIHAGEIRGLYLEEYPSVTERPHIQPTFETFGGTPRRAPGFSIVVGSQHPSYVLTGDAGGKSIQYQDDRIGLSWKKRGSEKNVYPRYEKIAEDFESYITRLNNYFKNKFQREIYVTQAEISYINVIELDEEEEIGSLFSLLDVSGVYVEQVNTIITEVLADDAGERPVARMHYAISNMGGNRWKFSLTLRGAPDGKKIGMVMPFISDGRRFILDRFMKFTTTSAHKRWGIQ